MTLRNFAAQAFQFFTVLAALAAMVSGLSRAKADGVTLAPALSGQQLVSTQMKDVEKALDMFYMACDRYPTTAEGLEVLRQPPNATCTGMGRTPFSKTSFNNDPWGRPWLYMSVGARNYTLKSLGADGREGGVGEDMDMIFTQDNPQLLDLDKLAKKYAFEPITEAGKRAAQATAEQLLSVAAQEPGHWNYSTAIHHAALVLGRLKLNEGDVESAGYYLNQAADLPASNISTQLMAFGPNMTLARELLVKKAKVPVLAYLDQCARFWTREEAQPRAKLDQWKAEIREGKIPDFGSNLAY